MFDRNILIISTSSADAQTLIKVMKTAGFTNIYTATEFESSFHKLKNENIELIIMDLDTLNQTNAEEWITALKQQKDIPFVYMIENENTDLLSKIKIHHSFEYLIKPARHDNLKGIIEMAFYKHQMDSRLNSSIERHRNFIDSIPDIVYFKDDQGRWIDANRATLEAFELKLEDYYKKQDEELAAISPKYRNFLNHASKLDEEAFKNKQKIRSEEHIIANDGCIRYYDVIRVPYFHHNGIPEGLMFIARDITDLKEKKEELGKLAKFRKENPNPVMRVSHEGKLLYNNSASKTLLDYWDCREGDLLPEEYRKIIHSIIQENKNVEIEVEIKDRSYILLFNPVFESDYVFLWGYDITTRKQGEDLLVKLTSAVEQAADNIVFTNKEGRIEYVNPSFERLTGFTKDEVLGKTPSILKSGKLPNKFYKNMWEILDSGNIFRGTFINRKKNQEIYYDEKTITPLKNSKGEITHYVATGYDITNRILSEQKLKSTLKELKRSNRDLEEFAYIVSHDLQGPLHVINGYTQLLLKKFSNNEESQEFRFTDYILKEVNWMSSLIKALLVYSRIGTDSQKLKLTNFNQVLTQAKDNLKTIIEENQANITNDELPIVNINEIQMVQLMQNLISNAIKFRKDVPPHIHIGVKENEADWIFSVKDNGIGIEEKNLKRIFQIFERIKSDKEVSGTGIGLAVCKKIVERHNGKIWIESEENKGSTFYFSLPKH